MYYVLPFRKEREERNINIYRERYKKMRNTNQKLINTMPSKKK